MSKSRVKVIVFRGWNKCRLYSEREWMAASLVTAWVWRGRGEKSERHGIYLVPPDKWDRPEPKSLALLRNAQPKSENQQSWHAARQILVSYKSKCFPVCMGKLWNRSPRMTLEFPYWETFKPRLEKAQRNLTSPCVEPTFTRRLDSRPSGVPSNLNDSLVLDEKCTKGGGFLLL